MASYKYKGINLVGKNVKGAIEESSRSAAIKKLSDSGIFVSSIMSLEDKKLGISDNKPTSFLGKVWKILNTEMYSFKPLSSDVFFQLSFLLSSGITLFNSLRSVAQHAPTSRDKQIVMTLSNYISEGVRLSEAMEKFPKAFSEMYINLTKAGEGTGRLADILGNLSDYEEEKKKNMSTITTAAAYPVFILLMSVAIFVGVLTIVVPMVTDVFAEFNTQLPFFTRVVIKMSDFFTKYGLLLLLFTILLFVLFTYFYRRKGKFRMLVDKFLYNSETVKYAIFSRYTFILAFQLREGLTLTQSLKFSNSTVANVYVKDNLDKTLEFVRTGIRFSESLKSCGMFPDMLYASAANGEKAGSLGDTFSKLSQYYAQRLQKTVAVVLSLLQPIMIVSIGLMVALLIMAILVPLLDINNLAQ